MAEPERITRRRTAASRPAPARAALTKTRGRVRAGVAKGECPERPKLMQEVEENRHKPGSTLPEVEQTS